MKTHYNDGHGPICGTGAMKIYEPSSLPAPSNEIGVVDCQKCVKKLVQWGHAIQHFNETIQTALATTKGKDRG